MKVKDFMAVIGPEEIVDFVDEDDDLIDSYQGNEPCENDGIMELIVEWITVAEDYRFIVHTREPKKLYELEGYMVTTAWDV